MHSFLTASALLALISVVAGAGVNLYTIPYTTPKVVSKRMRSLDTTSSTAAWTYYSAYPACCEGAPNYDPNADKTECQQYNRCANPGTFAGVGHRDMSYLESQPIVSFYDNADPNNEQWYEKYGNRFVAVTGVCNGVSKTFNALIADTCGNADCDNCCTRNADPSTGFLINVERLTMQRVFGGEGGEACADGKAKLTFALDNTQALAVPNCGGDLGGCNFPQHCCGPDNFCRQTIDSCFEKCQPDFGYCALNNGTCGAVAGGKTCPEGSCCGKDGYCGTTEEYCGTGCDEDFGNCEDPPETQSNGEARAFQFLPVQAGVVFMLATMFLL